MAETNGPISPTSVDASVSKPVTPPPTYTESAEPQYYFPRPTTSLPSSNGALSHPAFGPTPLALPQQQAVLLPYYDATSPHSIAIAVRRARWRFVGAVLWGVLICLVIGAISGTGAGAWKWDIFKDL